MKSVTGSFESMSKGPSSVHPSLTQARRAASIRKVVESVMTARASGAVLADSEVLAAHVDLMPELAGELRLLGVLERARSAAGAASAHGRSHSGNGDVFSVLSPDAFAGFRLGGEIHRGGQGVVYEARQLSTGRRVAIKVMREGIFGGDRDSARFEREVRILGQLEHPGIVGILASGMHAGHFFYVMDYISGLPLDDYAREHCGTARQHLELFLKVCDAVSAAHMRGIIHRDLKPANILVDEHGQPRILDFGLARITAEWSIASRVTRTGQFIGSMPWASPEQAMGDPTRLDVRTDVYALGVLLYQLLSGRFPYRVEGGPRDVLDQILTAAPARIRSTSTAIDEDLEAIAFKTLAKERERRYQSASELADDVRRYLAGRPVIARHASTAYQIRSFVRRNRPLVIGSCAVVLAIVLGLIGTSIGLVKASANLDASRRAEALAETRATEMQQIAYVASIGAADSALRAGDVATAKGRLAATPEHLRGWEWRYLLGQTEMSTLIVDQPLTLHMNVSPDGRAVAQLTSDGLLRLLKASSLASSDDKVVVLWEAAIPEDSRAPDEQVIACVSRDGAMIATGHGDHLLIWRIGDSLPISRLQFEGTQWGFIRADFNIDATRIAANGRERRLCIWDVQSGEQLAQFPVRWLPGVAYTPDGAHLIAVRDPHLVILDAATHEELELRSLPFVPRPGMECIIRLSPNGRILALSHDQDISLVSFLDNSLLGVLRGHSQRALDLVFDASGLQLASVGWDRSLRVWDLSQPGGHLLYWGHATATNGAGFLEDGRVVSSGYRDALRVWTGLPALGSTVARQSHGDMGSMVRAVSFHGPARFNALSYTDFRMFRIGGWQAGLKNQLEPLVARGPVEPVRSAAIDRTGRLIGQVDMDHQLTVRELESGAVLWGPTIVPAITYYLDFSPDSSMLATATAGGLTQLWDVASGELVGTLARESSIGYPTRFSPKVWASGSIRGAELAMIDAGVVTIWDAQRCTPLIRLQNDEDVAEPGAVCTAYSPDGSLLATGDLQGAIIIWDTETWRPLRQLTGMAPGVWSLAFSPDGKRLAAGSKDRTIRIWDPQSGTELLVIRGHTGTVMALAWSPDGEVLVSGSYDGTVRVWTANKER